MEAGSLDSGAISAAAKRDVPLVTAKDLTSLNSKSIAHVEELFATLFYKDHQKNMAEALKEAAKHFKFDKTGPFVSAVEWTVSVPMLFPSAVPPALFSKTVLPESAVIVTSRSPTPDCPFGRVRLKERAFDAPGAIAPFPASAGS